MSASRTKRPLTESELELLVRKAFGTGIGQWSELTEGTYNAAFAVTLDADVSLDDGWSGRELVLKVAPSPRLRLLTHEVDLMRTEVDFYRRAKTARVPVPVTVFADFDRQVIDSDYVFLSRVDGVAFDTVRDEMTPEHRATVRAQVATAANGLHGITGDRYGYPLRDSHSWQSSWRAAFGAMVDDVIADAVRLGSDLPMSPDRIGALIRRHADLLDDVQRPALVHFDLWDGNVFVSPDPALGWRLEGLIDGERAFYGDSVAELSSLGLFRDLDPDTLAPFEELTDRALRRLDLYNTYLYVVMAIEGATRGWDSPQRRQFEAWLGERLAELLAKL